ncbi:MAG TPA: undecaprenyl-diphosphate phosphatase [Acidimicrobiales bacterium]|nr:undecaprenyl-diphosphate phosphatase [Acidimicrobiales bacterium]
MLSYFQAVVIGLLQGVTELFPISSLGHSVVVPALLGWHNLVGQQSAGESPYLAFLVGLHVATALALLWFFREEWLGIARGLLRSVRRRRVEGPEERLAWLLVIATVPAGLTGLAFEHALRTLFAKPFAAACFLAVNGAILLAGERVRRRSEVRAVARTRDRAAGATEDLDHAASAPPSIGRLDTLGVREALAIGGAQVLALFAGISRSGITMVAGLVRGLDHDDAARFAFLLATPIIFAAGAYKVGDLLGHNGNGIRGQVLVGSLVAAAAAYVSVRFLVRYFTSRDLTPFGVYCLLVGVVLAVHFA